MAKINKDDLKIGVTFTRCKDCDRVEVVRCKDCKLRDTEDCFAAFWDSGQGLICDVKDTDFCSYGERVIK